MNDRSKVIGGRANEWSPSKADLYLALAGPVDRLTRRTRGNGGTITLTPETVDEDRQIGDQGIPGMPLR